MSRRTDALLHAVLAEALTPELQAGSLAATLREVRRGRAFRRWKRAAAWMALPILAVLITLPWSPAQTRVANLVGTPSVSVVTTQPISAAVFVETHSGAMPVVVSASVGLGFVETARDHEPVIELTDDNLLALLVGRSAALVRMGGETRLVLADSGSTARQP